MRPTLFVYIVAIGIPIGYMLFLFLFYNPLYWATLPEFIATALGIIISLGVARFAEYVHEQKQAKQVLKALKKELEVTKEKLTGRGILLYPDIWDSTISSGQIRLLNSEQVTRLAEVYRFIKGTDYEAKQVRDLVEDRRKVADPLVRNVLTVRWNEMSAKLREREAELREMIDDLLTEKWWTE